MNRPFNCNWLTAISKVISGLGSAILGVKYTNTQTSYFNPTATVFKQFIKKALSNDNGIKHVSKPYSQINGIQFLKT